ncbi:MAG: DEAD/DEAH box helicase [Opitutales bacterium]|nr:DEAD/DEAH box helicase [Opitutales bacterium]
MENKEKSTFKNLGLSEKILRAVENAGYEKPSPIQQMAIPSILKGRDIFGCAQTGTGKTAAFALPIMQMLDERGNYPQPMQFRALILTPTRELAEQIASNISVFGKGMDFSICKAYGGVSLNPQIKILANGVDILVATPGRLLDLFAQKKLNFGGVEYLVLDEADRMLDMGFIKDIKKICTALPKERQSMLFSATLSTEIESLAKGIVRNPERISVSPDKPTVEKISQKIAYIELENKFALLEKMMKARISKQDDSLALIFCRTKHGANKLAKRLCRIGLNADAIHGNKSQSARQNALNRFKRRETRILVATDIAARGIDVKDMSLVVNFDLPEEAETYVHRIGRTARAEADGEAISFCTTDDAHLLRAIIKFIKKEIATLVDNPYHSNSAEKASNLKTILSNKAQSVAKKITQIADAPARRKNGGKTDFSGRREKSAKTNSRKKFSEKKIGGVLKQKMKRASSKDFQKTHGAKKSIWSALKNKAGKFKKR